MADVASTPLHDLARTYGVAVDVRGEKEAQPDAEVVRGVLAAMGAAVKDDDAAREMLAALERARWQSVLPPIVVCREGWSPWVPVRLHDGSEFSTTLTLEDGTERTLEQVVHNVEPVTLDDITYREYTVEIPKDLPLGYHHLTVSAGGVDHSCEIAVVPRTMTLPGRLKKKPGWGLATQLYALRSERSWGIGDAADLTELGAWAAGQGADFVSITSVNADDPVSTIDPDPYRPATRQFLDPLAIRVEDIREFGYLSAAEHQLTEWHGDDARRLNADVEIDRDAVAESKRAALAMVFAVGLTPSRQLSFDRFLAEQGEALREYATWCVLARTHGMDKAHWPKQLRAGDEAAIAGFADEHANDIDFECWLQWVADEQLSRAQAELRAAGMRVGVINDLAPGIVETGADTWLNPTAYADGVRVIERTESGVLADTGLAPELPRVMVESAYSSWRLCVRQIVKLSGAVRISHAAMLFRQLWVPAGGKPADAVEVRFNHEALIGLLLLEAQRAGAFVIADNPAPLDAAMSSYLKERGILATHELWETHGAGVVDPKDFSKRAMATVSRRDGAPLAGYLDGTHAQEEVRYRVVDDAARRQAAVEKQRDEAMKRLTKAGLLSANAETEAQVAALYRYLRTAPSLLHAVRVADLIGDASRPGEMGAAHLHISWRRGIVGADERPVSLDALMTSRRTKRVLRRMGAS